MKIKKMTSLLLFVALLAFGCSQSAEKESTTNEVQQEQVKVQPATPSGQVDKFGRKPGDPHYGHNHASDEKHPTTTTTTTKPAEGKPDKFGRMPGDPHYGHNHE